MSLFWIFFFPRSRVLVFLVELKTEIGPPLLQTARRICIFNEAYYTYILLERLLCTIMHEIFNVLQIDLRFSMRGWSIFTDDETIFVLRKKKFRFPLLSD